MSKSYDDKIHSYDSCPECGSPQKFRPRRREEGPQLELYITCKTCRWEALLHSGPREVVEIELDIIKLRGRAERSSALRSLLWAREERLAATKQRLGKCKVCG